MTITQKCDGTIDGKCVKLIIIDKGYQQEFFAKPKEKDIDTPHIVAINGSLDVHLDSADGNSVRVMTVNQVGSGSLSVGSTFASNNGMDMVILPMHPTANQFAITTTYSGSSIKLQNAEEWCIMAFGTLEPWQAKKKKQVT